MKGIFLNKQKCKKNPPLDFTPQSSKSLKSFRVYFWMAIQMMKGIIIILVINHYVTHLGGNIEGLQV